MLAGTARDARIDRARVQSLWIRVSVLIEGGRSDPELARLIAAREAALTLALELEKRADEKWGG